MVNRVQSLRSSTAKARPSGQLPGMIYTNWPDKQLGVIDSGGNALDLIAVRFFSATTSYAVGDIVFQAGALYAANIAVSAGAFNPAQWNKLQSSADTGGYAYVPLAGGSMTGPLVLSADPTIGLGAVTKQYVDLHSGAVTVSATAPATPNAGALWWDSVGGQLYLWYDDGNTKQWVIAVTAITSLPAASTTVLGGVKVDGTSITAAADGTISTVLVPMNDNRIINGDMRIDQRNNGASSTVISAYTIDRWFYQSSASVLGTWGRNLNAVVGPAGFPYYLGFQSSSAHVSVAGDTYAFSQPIEADMVSDFAWGTASAQPVTLSFWAYSSLTGAFGGAIRNAAATRSYPFTYSIPSANTWTRIVIAIPGDTGGTWVMSGNAQSFTLWFDLGTGSTNRGPANAWVSGAYIGATGAVSVVATNGATFYVTGVKLEIGSVATPFNRQSLTKSLADCQRYYVGAAPGNLANLATNGYGVSAGYNTFVNWTAPVTMRAAPTITATWGGFTNASGGAITAQNDNRTIASYVQSAATGGYAGSLTITNLSAEL